MKEKFRQIYRSSTLATKIRYSYLILVVPIVVFLIFCFFNLWRTNRNYDSMINSIVVASEFSLDFKKDFDYETYLLIVENKTVEESLLKDMIADASRIVSGLEALTNSQENIDRLNSVKKYLSNLQNYVHNIEENLLTGNKYEENIKIWENDVQIVTALLQQSIYQYIYYEIRDIQQSHAEYQEFFIDIIRLSVIAFGCIILLIGILSYYIPLSITQPIIKISEVTDRVAKGDLSVRSNVRTGREVTMLNDSLNSMIDKINELLEQVKKEQIRIRKAEFELLQAQINPHFLYNTLDAIIWLAESGDQKKVVDMVGNLSDFFRTSLNQGKDIILLREEIQHVKSYLEILQVRYQDILQYEIDIPAELEKYMIPKITIQPLVENALYHGIKNKRGTGTITITGKEEKDYFVLQISDNGIGIEEEKLKQVKKVITENQFSGEAIYGLYNVNERIRLNFGETYGLSIESTYGQGTVVKIMLPYIEKKG